MAVNVKILDVPEMQMLVEFPGDANGLDFHHRIFWYRVDRSMWIISTPDLDVYQEDYDGMTVIPLSRNADYPGGYAGQLYVPQNDVVMRAYLDLKRQAESLAIVRGCTDRPGVPTGGDASDKRFGDIIPASDLGAASKNVLLEVGDQKKRLHAVGADIFTLEYVTDFDTWSNRKRPGLPGQDAGDLRLLGCNKLSSGRRQLSLEKAGGWPHRGPKAVKDFLESILQNGGDIMTYHSSFMRKSGLAENSAASHEYKNLLGVLRRSIVYDQVDPTNLACIEQVVRRVLEIQTAVRRNPKHPTFDSFDYNLRGTVDEVGGARASQYAEWIAEQQKAEAKALKGNREWREEQAADSRRAGRVPEKDDSDDDEGGGGGPKSKKKKKAKGWWRPGIMSGPFCRHHGGDASNSHGCKFSNSIGGGNHSDTFPLPVPLWSSRRVRSSAFLSADVGAHGEFGKRRVGRIAESVRALNTLGSTSGVDIRRGNFHLDGHQPSGRPTALQSAVLSRLSSRVVASGTGPTGMTPKSCFEEVIKSKDMYSLTFSMQCSTL